MPMVGSDTPNSIMVRMVQDEASGSAARVYLPSHP